MKFLTTTTMIFILAFVTGFSNYTFVDLENSYLVEQPIVIDVQLSTNHSYKFELYSTVNEIDTLLQTTTAFNTTSTHLSYQFTDEYDSLYIKVYLRTSIITCE